MKSKLSKWTTLLVFVGLMITSGVSLTAQTPTQSEPTAHWMAVTAHHVTPQKIVLTATRDSTAITGEGYNESHPSIAASPDQELFAAYEGTLDGSDYYPIFADSNDWTSGLYFQEAAGCAYPQVDYKTGGFYGTFQPAADPSTSGQIWIVDATDPTNPSGAYWDFGSFNFNAFTDFKLGTYTHAGPSDDGAWNWGGLSFVGYNGYNGANVEGCPFVFYQTDSEGNGVIGWLQGSVNGCIHAANDIDLVKNMSYSIYQRHIDGSMDSIIVRKDDFGKWQNSGSYYAHPMVTTKTLSDPAGNLANPDVVANNNTVLVVVQDDASGIVCYRSTNGFSSNSAIQVTTTADCLYPKVALIGTTAVVTYLKGTQVYYKISTDTGVTWGAEQLANSDDVVVPEYGATDIAAAGTHVYDVWQDIRGADRDIYYNDFYQPVAPVIEIGAINGGMGKVTAEIKNTGTGDASNVAWAMTVKGGMLGKINKAANGTIDSLPAGTTQVVTIKGIFGFGSITAKATAATASKTKTGKVILVFVKFA